MEVSAWSLDCGSLVEESMRRSERISQKLIPLSEFTIFFKFLRDFLKLKANEKLKKIYWN
jgi:hypothetical protein